MTIHYDQRGPVAYLTIDRRERRNAVDHEALEGLYTYLQSALDAETRALVLTGAWGHFCSGADLTGLEDESFAATLRTVLERAHRG